MKPASSSSIIRSSTVVVPAPRRSVERHAAVRSTADAAAAFSSSLFSLTRWAGSDADEAWDPAEQRALAQVTRQVREEAELYAAFLEQGGSVEQSRIDGTFRAFRTYRPFLGEAERALDTAAARRLSRALLASRRDTVAA